MTRFAAKGLMQPRRLMAEAVESVGLLVHVKAQTVAGAVSISEADVHSAHIMPANVIHHIT